MDPEPAKIFELLGDIVLLLAPQLKPDRTRARQCNQPDLRSLKLRHLPDVRFSILQEVADGAKLLGKS